MTFLTRALFPLPPLNSPVSPAFPKSELFPGQWKEKVLRSDIGIAFVVGGLAAWAACDGFGEVMAIYGGEQVSKSRYCIIIIISHTNLSLTYSEPSVAFTHKM